MGGLETSMTESARCLPAFLVTGAGGIRRLGTNAEQVGIGQYIGSGVLHSSYFSLWFC